ncbi:zinc ABC transporter substrate-binding protein [uncultured Rhodospira sp.]|uniref:metal ABC transporter solute-binding protein, Zn/Mn family n=1 Tax=uncultured Rhodospira sp. TaxID=1936189 RepID=UPI0026033EBA|nr:zinc ABC transporter substrate-binding protein [uncultured Rhodospira sp.]
MGRAWTGVAVFGILVPLVAGGEAARADTTPIDAVATIGMIGDVVANVGGACVETTTIMGPGVDPHLYQASAGDVRRFQAADVIFYAGYALEGQLGNVLDRFSRMKPTHAVAPESIEEADLITVEGDYGYDPHLWMDVSLWRQTVPTIQSALADVRPDCAEAMQANGERYRDQLAALHDWVADAVASIPERQRVLVTAHDAFGYYGRAYGIDVIGVQGISTESEAGIADIRHMAEVVAERRVPAVFVESTINPRTIQAVTDATRQHGHTVRIGGELYSDAMGEAGTVGGTYIGMIHENTVAIVEALGGTLPPLPEALHGWAQTWEIPIANPESQPGE